MLRDTRNFRRRDEKDYSAWVDEAANEPRTAHANNFGPRSRYPDGPPFTVSLWNPIATNRGLALRPPSLESTDQRLRIDAFVAQGCRGGLAWATAVLANDHA